jgi:hypothetical protein
VEPPGAGLPDRRPGPRVGDLSKSDGRSRGSRPAVGPVRIGATVAALALVLTSTGDLVVLGAALALAAADRAVFVTSALVAAASVGRWGSVSLAALAGDQAVLGWAGGTGEVAAVASSWAAGIALVVGAGGLRPRSVVVAVGLLAALVVTGPAATSTVDAAVRAGAGIAGVALALASARWLPRRAAAVTGVALGAIAAGLAVAS